MLRCPLCLQKMPEGSRMVRWCRRHPGRRQEFEVSVDDFTGIFCPDTECSPALDIECGVFLFHVGCKCRNPFVIPGTTTLDVARRRRLSNGSEVRHWEIVVAEEIAREDNRAEMWFPQALFRAANEASDGQPLGCLVMLAGSQSVGKSVLSLTAMSPLTYGINRQIQHFASIADSGASNEDLLRTLDAANQLQKGTMQQTILPTSAAHIANVKGVFLPRSLHPVAPRRPRNSFGTADVFVDLAAKLFPSCRSRKVSFDPSHTVAIFYDTGGELWQGPGQASTLNMRACADVQAIVVDITSFTCFGGKSSSSAVSVANEQLAKARGGSGKRCLIVTKLDAVSSMAVYTRTLKAGNWTRHEYREVLWKCLASSADRIEQRLWAQVESDPHLDIFFIWTEGLGQPGSAVQSYGLEGFVDWCFLRPRRDPVR